jgi:hypothetical protein
MNCLNCGTSLKDRARFCTKCGTATAPHKSNDDTTEILRPVATAYKQWEYHWELRTLKSALGGKIEWDKNILDRLTMLGEQGWELVAVVPRSGMSGESYAGFTTEEMWVFKRPKQG